MLFSSNMLSHSNMLTSSCKKTIVSKEQIKIYDKRYFNDGKTPDYDQYGANVEDLRMQTTLTIIDTYIKRELFRKIAIDNLNYWANNPTNTYRPRNKCEILLFNNDWGEVTEYLTRSYGYTFAVLNMANAYSFGGGYARGANAQEENMFRRTDCHFSFQQTQHKKTIARYDKNYTDKINAQEKFVPLYGANTEYTERTINSSGQVEYLNKAKPIIYTSASASKDQPEQMRCCFRPNEKIRNDLINETFILPQYRVFPFFELRVAAINRDKRTRYSDIEKHEMTKRIIAIFNTLKHANVRHVVLGAFGCGAFNNPPDEVANIFKRVINKFINDFDVIAFAILTPRDEDKPNWSEFCYAFCDNNSKNVNERIKDVTEIIIPDEEVSEMNLEGVNDKLELIMVDATDFF